MAARADSVGDERAWLLRAVWVSAWGSSSWRSCGSATSSRFVDGAHRGDDARRRGRGMCRRRCRSRGAARFRIAASQHPTRRSIPMGGCGHDHRGARSGTEARHHPARCPARDPDPTAHRDARGGPAASSDGRGDPAVAGPPRRWVRRRTVRRGRTAAVGDRPAGSTRFRAQGFPGRGASGRSVEDGARCGHRTARAPGPPACDGRADAYGNARHSSSCGRCAFSGSAQNRRPTAASRATAFSPG